MMTSVKLWNYCCAPANACLHLLMILTFRQTTSWDVDNLSLSKFVVYGCKTSSTTPCVLWELQCGFGQELGGYREFHDEEEDEEKKWIKGQQIWYLTDANPGGLKRTMWLEVMNEFNCFVVKL